MNPTKKLLILLVSLSPILVSANVLDGKSLICRKLDGEKRHLGFKFDGGKIHADIIWNREEQTKIQIENLDDLYKNKEIRESRNHIFFSNWQLDRKTLVLMVRGGGTLTAKYQCEVIDSFNEYSEQLEEIVGQEQRRVDEEMQDNRI